MAAANSEELAELNRKLKSSEDDLDLLKKQFDEAQGKSKTNCYCIYLLTIVRRLILTV